MFVGRDNKSKQMPRLIEPNITIFVSKVNKHLKGNLTFSYLSKDNQIL